MKNLIFLCIGLLVTIAAVVQNVSIGTSIPNAKLNVRGTLNVADDSQGADKVLTSDITGLASLQPFPPPPGTDYPSVIIGSQKWMTKNLDVSTYRNGDVIPIETNAAAWAALTTGAYCYYNNAGPFNNIYTGAPSSAVTYGKLYNWYAVNDPRGLAPEGWKIPTDSEWTALSEHLEGDFSAGGKLKDTTHWRTPNTGATNLSGFTGLPGGYRIGNDGTFKNIGKDGYWWSSTAYNANLKWCRNLMSSSANFPRDYHHKRNGFSVRCLRD